MIEGPDKAAEAAAVGEGARPSGSKRRAKRPSGKAATSGVVQRGVMDAFRPVDVSDVTVNSPPPPSPLKRPNCEYLSLSFRLPRKRAYAWYGMAIHPDNASDVAVSPPSCYCIVGQLGPVTL